MVTAMRLDWGEEKTKQWLEGVMANEADLLRQEHAHRRCGGCG